MELFEYIKSQLPQMPNSAIMKSMGASEELIDYVKETPWNTNLNVMGSITGSGSGNASVVKYTVSFNLNGGEGSLDPIEVVAGESIDLPGSNAYLEDHPNFEMNNFAPSDLGFYGWAESSSAQNPTVEFIFTPDKDTILYAVWGEIQVI